MKLGNDESSKELEGKSEAKSWQAAEGETPVDADDDDNFDDDDDDDDGDDQE